MTFISSERPGIYSDYEASSIVYSNYGNKTVGIVGKSSLNVEGIVYINRAEDAVNTFGEDSPIANLCIIALKNGAYNIAAIAVDSNSPNYQDAFALLSAENNICAVMCDSESLSVHKLLENSVNIASQNAKERIGIIGCSSNENIQTWADNFNNERIVLIAQQPVDDKLDRLSSNYIAAALCGIIAKNLDLSSSFNGSELNDINNLSTRLSENDIDTYIKNGITTFEYIDSKVKIIRAVTSRTKTDNITDPTFKELNTILIIDDVISSIRQVLESFIKGSKNNVTTRSAISTQTTIKLEEYLSLNIIDSYNKPKVTTSPNDPSVCIVEVEFTVSRGLNQINISAHIKV